MKAIMNFDWNGGVRQIVSGFLWTKPTPSLMKPLAGDPVNFRRVSIFSFVQSWFHNRPKVFGAQDPERREAGA